MQKINIKRTLWNLFISFTKISFVTFGGGNAVVPFLEKEFVEKDGSISLEDLLSVVTVANSLPGPSMFEMAAGVGYFIRGKRGAVVSVLGISLPICVLFTLLYSYSNMLVSNRIFQNAMKAVIPVIVGILARYSLDFFIKSRKEMYMFPLLLIVIVSLVLINYYSINPSILVVFMILAVSIQNAVRSINNKGSINENEK